MVFQAPFSSFHVIIRQNFTKKTTKKTQFLIFLIPILFVRSQHYLPYAIICSNISQAIMWIKTKNLFNITKGKNTVLIHKKNT